MKTNPLRRHLPLELLEHELELARQVQESLLPAELPSVSGVRLAAVNRPARIVSGDLYDVIRLDPERLAIVCADVSGKGFAAALLASEFHAFCRATLRAACVFADTSLGPLPVQVVSLLNSDGEGSRTREQGKYATVFFAEFDAGDGLLRYVNAGHNPPLLFVPHLAPEPLSIGGPPVGLFENSMYDAGSISIPPGGRLLIYTDGIVEARSSDDEEFGLERLIEVCAGADGGVDQLLSDVMEAVAAWSAGTEQTDDMTLVALERLA